MPTKSKRNLGEGNSFVNGRDFMMVSASSGESVRNGGCVDILLKFRIICCLATFNRVGAFKW